MIIRWPRHIRERCTDDECERCMAGTCITETLFSCRICGGAEGDLPTDCPGERVPYELLREVHIGRANYLRHHGWVTIDDLQFRSNG